MKLETPVAATLIAAALTLAPLVSHVTTSTAYICTL
jgi:hypothetical protein